MLLTFTTELSEIIHEAVFSSGLYEICIHYDVVYMKFCQMSLLFYSDLRRMHNNANWLMENVRDKVGIAKTPLDYISMYMYTHICTDTYVWSYRRNMRYSRRYWIT